MVMQLCLIPTQPTVAAGHSLLDFMEKILEGMMVQLFVEVDCCPMLLVAGLVLLGN